MTTQEAEPTQLAPRARLTPDAIVRAVLDLGVDRFSMHSVARHLGVSATALYRHVASRDELIALTMDSLCAGIDRPSTGRDWRAYMRELAHSFRRILLSMPGSADYGSKIGPATPAALAIVDHALGVLRDAGFSPPEAWRVYSLVVNYAFSAVQGQERFNLMEAEHGSGGYRVFRLAPEERDRFPNVAWSIDGIDFDFDATFAANVDAIIAGLEPG